MRILVADDEPDMRLLVRAHVRRVPEWSVTDASDGAEALALAVDEPFDVLVLDQRMPELTGIEVVRALRERGEVPPVVLFSAYLDPDIEDEAAALGVRTLGKSDLSRLNDTIAGLLDTRLT